MKFDEWMNKNGIDDEDGELRESLQKAWDAGAANAETKLLLVAAHFAAALHRITTRPGNENESAFIAVTALDSAKKMFGYEIMPSLGTPRSTY